MLAGSGRVDRIEQQLAALHEELARGRQERQSVIEDLRRAVDDVNERIGRLEEAGGLVRRHEDRLNGGDERLETLETQAREDKLAPLKVRLTKLERLIELQAEDQQKIATGMVERLERSLRTGNRAA